MVAMSRGTSACYPAYVRTARHTQAASIPQTAHLCIMSMLAMHVSTTCPCGCFADAKWLATSFFSHYSSALAQPGIDITSPADAVFLTDAELDLLNWDQPAVSGNAWRQSVQTALKQISLEDRYQLCKQRFPRSLASVGIHEAGMHLFPWLQHCRHHTHAC